MPLVHHNHVSHRDTRRDSEHEARWLQGQSDSDSVHERNQGLNATTRDEQDSERVKETTPTIAPKESSQQSEAMDSPSDEDMHNSAEEEIDAHDGTDSSQKGRDEPKSNEDSSSNNADEDGEQTERNKDAADYEAIAEESEIEELKSEIAHDENEIYDMKATGSVVGIFLVILTAHQMSENPNGLTRPHVDS